MNSKKIIILVLLLSTSMFYGQQKGKGNRDKIKALRIAYITERLELSSEEAQVFWPIYNKHQKTMDAYRKEERTKIFKVLEDMANMPDKDVEALLQKHIEIQEKKHKAEKLHLIRLNGILSAKKIFLLLKTENSFKRRLLKQYRHKKDDKQKHP